MKQIHRVFCFLNGALVCCDASGAQVPEHQRNMLWDRLEQMRAEGVVDNSTILHLENITITVGQFFGEIKGDNQ